MDLMSGGQNGTTATVMTMAQMREHYVGEWLLIAYEELNDGLEVVRGEVIAHSPNRDDIYERLRDSKSRTLAIEYAGEIPEDLAVVL